MNVCEPQAPTTRDECIPETLSGQQACLPFMEKAVQWEHSMDASCTFSEGVMPDTEPGQSLHRATKTLSYAWGGNFS